MRLVVAVVALAASMATGIPLVRPQPGPYINPTKKLIQNWNNKFFDHWKDVKVIDEKDGDIARITHGKHAGKIIPITEELLWDILQNTSYAHGKGVKIHYEKDGVVARVIRGRHVGKIIGPIPTGLLQDTSHDLTIIDEKDGDVAIITHGKHEGNIIGPITDDLLQKMSHLDCFGIGVVAGKHADVGRIIYGKHVGKTIGPVPIAYLQEISHNHDNVELWAKILGAIAAGSNNTIKTEVQNISHNHGNIVKKSTDEFLVYHRKHPGKINGTINPQDISHDHEKNVGKNIVKEAVKPTKVYETQSGELRTDLPDDLVPRDLHDLGLANQHDHLHEEAGLASTLHQGNDGGKGVPGPEALTVGSTTNRDGEVPKGFQKFPWHSYGNRPPLAGLGERNATYRPNQIVETNKDGEVVKKQTLMRKVWV
ncbi:uncharacterized protein BDZ99DRAFT_515150 [Mytilinidion resinicola]|uniref:Uncharacterized protein n=1 Tax=Mytilinidion resinicola TaxID=574789 RepID=A0A6A6Z8F8_9PEZI|nr:uncharacterized protein BDZ99DRAFT_515150 [Mytilinidion resinicola]KAF2816565.1 hypothetical protein BDZ99DRAFT_515150 [Mytilinidion resinicola]